MPPSMDTIIRDHCHPMVPIETGQSAQLKSLPDIRVVLLDIYGTLLISASGDFSNDGDSANRAFRQALHDSGLTISTSISEPSSILYDEIRAEHDRRRATGIEHPEVDIVEVWNRAFVRLQPSVFPDRDKVREFALRFELLANPVWPMPGAAQCLRLLHRRGIAIGLISNAQFMTEPVLRVLLNLSNESDMIDPRMKYYSYEIGQAKPSLHAFLLAREEIRSRGCSERQVLVVGNDRLKDILPASTVGFRTALYAGDARSLRLRTGDPRLEGGTEDLVLTSWQQLATCLS
jgi:putative hydrolase of the HAD superfamily